MLVQPARSSCEASHTTLRKTPSESLRRTSEETIDYPGMSLTMSYEARPALGAARRAPRSFGANQLNAKASKLEHSSTKPAAVNTRNPSDTRSWSRMITPATLNAGPNSLKFSKSAFLKAVPVVALGSDPRAKTLKCVGKENAGANQAQKRCNCLNHRKDPLRPGGRERHAASHSQRDSPARSKIGPD
jgi:hypothetical protein